MNGQGVDGAPDVAPALLRSPLITRVVVNELASDSLAEVRVGLRVEDEGVPADVNQR